MHTTRFMSEGTRATLSRGLPRRAWTALFGLLTLACVAPSTRASASPPATGGSACDGGTCGEPKPATPQQAMAPASPVAAPDASIVTPAPAAPATAPTSAPATPGVSPDAGVASAAPEPAKPLCDTDWPDGHAQVIQIGERKADGQPLQPFEPLDPMYPYELPGDRFLFGEKGMVYTLVGRFEDLEEANVALRKVELERPSSRAFRTSLGPYLLPESRTCKVTPMARMKNPVIDSASWILEKDGVLLAGTQSQCKDGMLTKKVSVLSCDGMKTLFTDSSKHICEQNEHVATCVYPLERGVLLFNHSYTFNGVTTVQVRVYDVRQKKQLYNLEVFNGSVLPGQDPNFEPRTDLEDVDQDGLPEIVTTLPEAGQRTSVLKWRHGTFVKLPLP